MTDVKKASFKAEPARNGFIRTTISPVHDDHEARFGWCDILMLVALIVGVVAVARVLLAH